MKKTLLVTSLAVAMGVATTADAAFTPLGDGNYQMRITNGCFDFGNCQTLGSGVISDNTTANQADTLAFGALGLDANGDPYGSGIVGDGFMGVVDFTLTGGVMAVTSYSQDSYLATAGGTFYLRSLNITTMGGGIDAAGNMSFDPTGRMGLAAGYITTLGEQEWNRDDTSDTLGTGLYEQWTTGTSTNRVQGTTVGFDLFGSALVDVVTNEWTGTLVSAGNIGQAWGGFDNQQYAEVLEVTILLVDPVANDDIVATAPSTPVLIDQVNLLSNDTHNLNEALSFDSYTLPISGGLTTLVDNGDNTFTYTPDASLIGVAADSFTYTISDISGDQSTATVVINVATGNPPVAVENTPTIEEDTVGNIDPIADDQDIDGDTLVLYNFVDGFSGQGGTVTAAGNTVTYTPLANFSGIDTFSYDVHDGNGNVVTGLVTVTVAQVNDAPVCSNVSLTTGVDLPLTISVADDLLSATGTSPLCVDVDNDPTLNDPILNDIISFATIDTTGDQGGTLAADGAGSLTYTPVAGFQGTEKFAFTASDGKDDSTTVNELSITVGALKSNFTMMDQAGITFGGTNDVEFVWNEITFNDSVTVNQNGIPTDTNFSIITISSPFPFFNANWFAHNVRIFKNTTGAPITLNFDISCNRSDYDADKVDCGGTTYMTLTLEAGEIGAHILFDWGETGKTTTCGQSACDIDVVNKWQENAVWTDLDGSGTGMNNLWLGAKGIAPAVGTTWRLVSTDVNGDGINGTPMLDGPFIDNYANFNYKPAGSGESLPPYTENIDDVSVDSLAFSMGWWSLLAGLLSVFGLRRINNKK